MLQLSLKKVLHYQVSLKIRSKKLVLVLATSVPVTVTKKEAVEAIETAGSSEDGKENEVDKYLGNLVQVQCIRYSITFQKDFVPMSTFFDSGSKINAIHPIFAKEQGLFIRPIDVKA